MVALLYLAFLGKKNNFFIASNVDGTPTDSEQKILDAVIEWHKDVGAPQSESPDIFLATYFSKRGKLVARSCGLYLTGDIVLASESQRSFEVEPSPKGKLTTEQMAQISKLIQELPPDSKPQHWRELFTLTFLDNKRKPHTRLYAHTDLPPQVNEIYRITSAPLETNKS